MKHYKSVEFLSIFRMSSHPAQTQSPLLLTFWRRFCLNLGDSNRLQMKVFLALIDSEHGSLVCVETSETEH